MIKQIKNIPIWKKIILIDILSMIAAYYLVNYLDIIITDYRWIQWMKANGLLHIYDSWDIDIPIDYPPLYMIWLYSIRNLVGTPMSNYTQLIMKLLPLIVQVISQVFIYRMISPEAALGWSVNFALLVNVVIYGQRDGIVGFLIVLLYYYMTKQKCLEPALVVTAFCLLKPQGLYFVFILLFYYIKNKVAVKKVIMAMTVSIVLGYIVFLPFAVTSGDYLISVKLYLYEFGVHKVFGSVAGSFWGLFEHWRLPVLLEQVSTVLVIGCMLTAVFVYRKTNSFIYSSIIYMLTIFMFTISQHGRYSIYTMFILYIAIYIYGYDEYKEAYRIITISTVLAQLGIILYNRIMVGTYGLDIMGVMLDMTYDMLYRLYTLRYITIVSTFMLNVICIKHLIRIGVLQAKAENSQI